MKNVNMHKFSHYGNQMFCHVMVVDDMSGLMTRGEFPGELVAEALANECWDWEDAKRQEEEAEQEENWIHEEQLFGDFYFS